MIKRGRKYCQLSELKVNVGEVQLLLNQKITKIKQVGIYNLLIYKKTEISSQFGFREMVYPHQFIID
ncbi:MAG: hypothetical protein WBA93_31315 [Microcoleaceae cyanobacterium]